MRGIVARDVVALGPQALNESVGGPALEGEGAGFDALHERRAREQGFVGSAHVGVGGFVGAAVGEGCGGVPVGGAGVGLVVGLLWDFLSIFVFSFS